MPYIIDGNNLIGSAPDIQIQDPEARKKLLHIIRKFQQNKNNKIVVVFDGEPERDLHEENITHKLKVCYPSYGFSADDEIKKILNEYHNYRDFILVTSDRELRTFAKEKGIKTINSIEFYFELKRAYRLSGKKEAHQKRIETELSDLEVDHWLKIFKKD